MSFGKKCVCRNCAQALHLKAIGTRGRVHCPKCGIWNRVHASPNIDIYKPFINIKNIFFADLLSIKKYGFIYLFKKSLLSELSCFGKNLLSLKKYNWMYLINREDKYKTTGNFICSWLFVFMLAFSIFLQYPLYKDVISDIYVNGFDDSEPADSSSPENILAVKESPSNPTVGIISNSKGKPGYLYVPGRKSYEVTYEENGILKTKTMSSDPTK